MRWAKVAWLAGDSASVRRRRWASIGRAGHGRVQGLPSLDLHFAIFKFTIHSGRVRTEMFQACWGPAWSVVANAVAGDSGGWNRGPVRALAARSGTARDLGGSRPDPRTLDHIAPMVCARGNRIPVPTADHTSNRLPHRTGSRVCLDPCSATPQLSSRLQWSPGTLANTLGR